MPDEFGRIKRDEGNVGLEGTDMVKGPRREEAQGHSKANENATANASEAAISPSAASCTTSAGQTSPKGLPCDGSSVNAVVNRGGNAGSSAASRASAGAGAAPQAATAVAGGKRGGRGAGRVLAGIIGDAPGFAIAVAGLAFAMLAKESQKMPGFQSVSMGAPERWVPALIALIPVAALLLAYRANPRFRLYRNPAVGFCIGGVLLLATLPATGTTVVVLPDAAAFACRVVSRCCELLLMLCWMEVLLQLTARQAAAIVGAALVGVGGLDMALSMLKPDFASLCTACLAPLSMGLLYWFKDYNHFLRGGKTTAPGQALAVDASLHATAGPSAPAFVVALLLPFTCYPFVLGSIHSTWLPQQGVAATALHVQFGYAAGALFAGVLCLYLVVAFWGRRKVELYNLIALPFLMMALYLTAMSGDGYLLLYAFLQSFTEKLAMFLMFIVPFLVVSKLPAMMTWLGALVLFEVGKLLASGLLTAIPAEAYSLCTIAAAFALALASVALVVIDSSKGTGAGAEAASAEAVRAEGEAGSNGNAAAVTANANGAVCELAPSTFANGGAHEATQTADENRATAAPAGNTTFANPTPQAGQNAAAAPGSAEANLFRETPVERIAREYRLTNREEEVLQLLAQGMTARAISEELIISPGTAKSHLRNIYAKLGVHTQSELILLVHESQ